MFRRKRGRARKQNCGSIEQRRETARPLSLLASRRSLAGPAPLADCNCSECSIRTRPKINTAAGWVATDSKNANPTHHEREWSNLPQLLLRPNFESNIFWPVWPSIYLPSDNTNQNIRSKQSKKRWRHRSFDNAIHGPRNDLPNGFQPRVWVWCLS